MSEIFKNVEKHVFTGHRWLTPVILAIQEVGIRRIAVQSQPRQIVRKTLSWKKQSQKKADGVAQGIGPEFKPQDHKKKEKERKAYFHTPTDVYSLSYFSIKLKPSSGLRSILNFTNSIHVLCFVP
jgi:hypothetical protein